MQKGLSKNQKGIKYIKMASSQSKDPLMNNNEIEMDEKHVENKDVIIEEPEDPKKQYTFDYCMRFLVGEDSEKVTVWSDEEKKRVEIPQKEHFFNVMVDILKRMEISGLKTDLWYSVQKDEVFCRIGASEKRLQQEADRVDLDIQLDKDKCLEYAKAMELKLARTTEDPNGVVKEEDWLNLYGKYDQFDEKHPERQELYLKYNDEPNHPRKSSFFTDVNRLKLTVGIIEADPQLGGVGLSVSKAVTNENHPLSAFFPLHDTFRKDKLQSKWYNFWSTFKGPLQEIREYFGEAIALYFAFLGFYNRVLLAATILGVICFVWQIGEGDEIDNWAMPLYSFVFAIGVTLFLELWKRREAKYRIKWGMSKFLEKEQPRPEFKGDWQPSPINGSLVEVFPWLQKLKRFIFSWSIVIFMILVVVGCIIGLILARVKFKKWSPKYGDYLTSIATAIQIQILNAIYSMVSRKLNDQENHRTDTQYENSLIAKSFLFKFVNSYNSLIYIAFFKAYESDDPCTYDDEGKGENCLKILRIQLAIIFGASIVVNNASELLIPYLQNWYEDYKNRQVVVGDEANNQEKGFVEKSKAEIEYELQEYESTFEDYDELVIQFGYVTLFSVVFPLVPLMALLNNWLEVYVDSTKLLALTRRPEPRGAYDIGTWYSILDIMSTLAVVSNTALVFFASDPSRGYNAGDSDFASYKNAMLFIMFEHAILILKFAVAYFVPDEPEEIQIHQARQEYLVNVLINGMEEEDDDEILEGKDAMQVKEQEFDMNLIADTCRKIPGHDL